MILIRFHICTYVVCVRSSEFCSLFLRQIDNKEAVVLALKTTKHMLRRNNASNGVGILNKLFNTYQTLA